MYPIKQSKEIQLFSGRIEKISQKPTSYGIKLDNTEVWLNGQGSCPYENNQKIHAEAEKNKQGFWWITEEKKEEIPEKTLESFEEEGGKDEDELIVQLRRIADSLEDGVRLLGMMRE